MFIGYEALQREHRRHTEWVNCFGWMLEPEGTASSQRGNQRGRTARRLRIGIAAASAAIILASVFELNAGLTNIPAPNKLPRNGGRITP